jgi:Ca-activated chloride channel family protein
MFLARLLSAALAAFLIFSSASTANERIMIVLDGSGSMWGQIDGVPKLQIARDTLRDVLKTVPEDTELGLLAYGHRKKGDCSDIEMIVPPALGTASTIVEKADKMKFLGKTPLTAAVKQAAEELRYVEDAATVVLITDGLETCKANVCELGSLLEEQGANFTAHVVGFGLSKEEGAQVACLAENTGGKYFSADNGDALSKALQDTVVAAPPSVTLVPVDQDGAEVKATPMQWTIRPTNGEETQQQNGNGKVSLRLNAGNYEISIDGPEIAGGGAIEVVADKRNQEFKLTVELNKLEATLDAPDSAVAGSEISVTWTGPDHDEDYITVVEKGARDGDYLGYAYTNAGNPAVFMLPDGLGEYELRYMHGETARTIGSRPITLTEFTGTLEGPEKVAAGAQFDVNWTGPNYPDDYITIVASGAPEGSYKSYEYTKDESPATLKAPDEPGTYELRYVVGNGNRTLASQKIEVTSVSAQLTAPESAPAGSRISVEWVGPNNSDDYITIVAPDAPEGSYSGYAYTKDGSPAVFNAPDATGPHEIRYVNGGSSTTLTSKMIELTALSGSLDATGPFKAGEQISVMWEGPNNPEDYITIVEVGAPKGTYKDYAYTTDGSPVTFGLPKEPGEYELRYVLGGSNRTLTSKTISVE